MKSSPDAFERLTERFVARAIASPDSRIDVLIDLEYLGDLRIVGFLLQVLANPQEATDVRIHALKWLRCGQCGAGDRHRVADAIRRIAIEKSTPGIRLHAVLALADFTDFSDVVSTLGTLTLDSAEPIDLRYCAFTSLERAGLTPESRAVLWQLIADTALGPCARNALTLWRTN
jgi:hypothetical protein